MDQVVPIAMPLPLPVPLSLTPSSPPIVRTRPRPWAAPGPRVGAMAPPPTWPGVWRGTWSGVWPAGGKGIWIPDLTSPRDIDVYTHTHAPWVWSSMPRQWWLAIASTDTAASLPLHSGGWATTVVTPSATTAVWAVAHTTAVLRWSWFAAWPGVIRPGEWTRTRYHIHDNYNLTSQGCICQAGSLYRGVTNFHHCSYQSSAGRFVAPYTNSLAL